MRTKFRGKFTLTTIDFDFENSTRTVLILSMDGTITTVCENGTIELALKILNDSEIPDDEIKLEDLLICNELPIMKYLSLGNATDMEGAKTHYIPFKDLEFLNTLTESSIEHSADTLQN